ncbi:MAG: hypothetical protein QM739_13715 [Propionivibrio sp.]
MNVTTWQATPSHTDDAQAAPAPSSRVVGGTLTMIGNHQVQTEQSGTIRCSGEDLAPNHPSIAATAQNNGGFYTQNITPDSTVEIPGFGRTTVKVAERLGYIQKSADGTFKDTDQRDFAPQKQETVSAELFGAKTEQAYSEMIAPIPQAAYDQVLGSGAAMLFSENGQDLEALGASLAPRLSSATGMEPDKARQIIDAGASAWKAQADAVVRAAGADPDEFYTWAKENRRDALQQAVVQQLYSRNCREYKALAQEFQKVNIPTFEALDKKGYSVKKASSGETLIETTNGQWISAAVARRLGKI